MPVAEVGKDFSTPDIRHEGAADDEVVDTVAHLEVTPVAVECWFLFGRMQYAVRIDKVTLREKEVKVIALPFSEIGTRLFELTLEIVVICMDDIHITTDYDRKPGREFADEGTEIGVPSATIIYRTIESFVREWNVCVQKSEWTAIKRLEMSAVA